MVSGNSSNLWVGNLAGGKLAMVECVAFKNICGVHTYIYIYIYIYFIFLGDVKMYFYGLRWQVGVVIVLLSGMNVYFRFFCM